MNYKKSRKLMLWGCGLAIFLLMAGEIFRIDGLIIVGAAVILGSFLQASKFYRCPHCGAQIYGRGFQPDYCASCGEKIDWT